MEKITKQKELPQMNQKFLELSNLITEQMINIEKINQWYSLTASNMCSKTPRLLPANSMKASVLLNTPTLKRRAPLSSMMGDLSGSGGLQNKLLSRNVEKIEEESSNEEGKKVDDKKDAMKRLLIGTLPMIPENKPSQAEKQQIA
jgi:hypothetical protein